MTDQQSEQVLVQFRPNVQGKKLHNGTIEVDIRRRRTDRQTNREIDKAVRDEVKGSLTITRQSRYVKW